MSLEVTQRPIDGHSIWNASDNPLVYKFQRQDYIVDSIQNAGGNVQVNLNDTDNPGISVLDFEVGETVYIDNVGFGFIVNLGSGAGVVNIITDIIWASQSAGAYLNNLSTRQNYVVEIIFYDPDNNTQYFRNGIQYTPSQTGEVVADVSSVMASFLIPQILDTQEQTLARRFYIQYIEKYNDQIDTDVTDFTNIIGIVLAYNQLLENSNLKEYITELDGANVLTVGKFLTRFANPSIWIGWPNNYSVISDVGVQGLGIQFFEDSEALTGGFSQIPLDINQAELVGAVFKPYEPTQYRVSKIDGAENKLNPIERFRKVNASLEEIAQVTPLFDTLSTPLSLLSGTSNFSLWLLAQTFTMTQAVDGDLFVDIIWGTVFGSPDFDIRARITTVTAGEPDIGNVLYTADALLDATTLSTGDASTYTTGWSFTGVNLSNGVQYAIVFDYQNVVSLNPDFVGWVTRLENGVYAGGEAFYSADSGSTWLNNMNNVEGSMPLRFSTEQLVPGEKMFEDLIVKVKDPCRNPIMIQWVNSLGGISEWLFERSQNVVVDYTSGDIYERSFNDLENTNRTTGKRQSDFNDSWECFAEHLSVDEVRALTEIKSSPSVYAIRQDGTRIGVISESVTTSYKRKDETHSFICNITFPTNFDSERWLIG